MLFAPAGELVPVALRALDRGGTLSIAGIHLTTIPPIDYDHELFEERQVRSVTANTRVDGEELLELAARIPLRPRTTVYAFEDAARGPRRPRPRPRERRGRDPSQLTAGEDRP